MSVISVVLLMYSTLIGHLTWSFNLRIQGGVETKITEFPYFGYIVSGVVNPNTGDIDPTPLCGAVLIADCYILTHASCVENYIERKLFVQFGMKSWCPPIDYVEELHHYADLIAVDFQPDYDGLAVATLDRSIPITPINAPQSRTPFQNSLFGLPGLGKTGPNSLRSCKPLVAQLVPGGPDPSLCPAESGVLCFQPFFQSLRGSMCYGDEGGPLIERIEGKDFLRGIAWKNADSDCRGTNLVRDVWAALPWIQQTVPNFHYDAIHV